MAAQSDDLGGAQDPLAVFNSMLGADPDAIEVLYLRAGLLAEAGRTEEAKADYIAVITRDNAHFGALNDLGTLLYNTGFRTAARTAYAEAVRQHPDNPIGRINLANALAAAGEVDGASLHYEVALKVAPDHPDAHQGLANLLQDQGDFEAAEHHRQLSYVSRGVSTLPYRGDGEGCRVLLLVSAVGGNVPTRFLLDDTRFAVSVLAIETWRPGMALPDHDLIVNAIGDADLCPDALRIAATLLEHDRSPVINPPARVCVTGRASIATSLGDLPGVQAPAVILARRTDLERQAARIGYPLLIRSPGFHTGRHFERVAGPHELGTMSEGLPGAELLMIEHLEARDAVGRYRKYRVMIIGGRLYPLHLAISDSWKVHYYTADMIDRPDHRIEEDAFLRDMGAVIGLGAVAALGRIVDRLGLDYAGVDFGIGPDGVVLLFEANATMVINPPDADPRWDYRRGAVERALQAAQTMMLERAETDPA